MENKFVITGVGIVSTISNSVDEFYHEVMVNKKPSPRKFTRTNAYNKTVEGFIFDNFQIEDYIQEKGLRYLDRMTGFALAGCLLALNDSDFTITKENNADCGISMGNTFGSLDSVSEFDMVSLTEGFKYLYVAGFANTIINSATGQIAVKLNTMGPTVTFSTGSTATLDAFSYCLNSYCTHNFDFMLVGGVEELSFLCSEYYASIFPSEEDRPVPGEGAAMFCLEPEEKAKKRNAKIYASVIGCQQIHGNNIPVIEISRSLMKMFFENYLSPSDVDYIITNKNGTGIDDSIDEIIDIVFQLEENRPPQYNLIDYIGETNSASGAFQIALAMGIIKNKSKESDNSVGKKCRILIINYSIDGNKSFMFVEG